MQPDGVSLVEAIQEQEARLQFSRFTFDDAWELGSLLVSLARERSLPITIDIRRGDQQVFHAAMAGTSADNDDWIERKIRAVRRFGISSFQLGRIHAAAGTDFASATGLASREFAAHGGCFPIVIRDGGMVGSVTVSGLPQAEDHALVVEALETHLR